MSAPAFEALLIGCGAEKRAERCRAEELYTSRFFQAKRAYAIATRRPWAILSAQHGVLSPDEWTAPYDKTIAALSRWERREWAAGVVLQVFAWRRYIERIGIIAGDAYLHPLTGMLRAAGVEIFNPCAGLGIGQQIAWLRNKVEAA